MWKFKHSDETMAPSMLTRPLVPLLSDKGILHQTSCPDKPPQNGAAKRKNRYLLEVARALIFTMNVPKFLWSKAVKMTPSWLTACHLGWHVWNLRMTWFFTENKFPVPPKVFGCTCFVRDHRPSVNKLDPQAVKCIFIGYSLGQREADICEHGCYVLWIGTLLWWENWSNCLVWSTWPMFPTGDWSGGGE